MGIASNPPAATRNIHNTYSNCREDHCSLTTEILIVQLQCAEFWIPRYTLNN